MTAPRIVIKPNMQHNTAQCSVQKGCGEELQIALRIRRQFPDAHALDRRIACFIDQCLAQEICQTIRFQGMSSWSEPGGGTLADLYFCALSDVDGHGENGNGIAASASAAYANIWAKYAST